MKSKAISYLQIASLAISLALLIGCSTKQGVKITQQENQAKMQEPSMENEKAEHKMQKGVHLSVLESSIATSMVDLEPQGVGKTFQGDVNKLYCYTKIENQGEDSYIHHIWMHNGQEMANVKLNVRGSHFRTFSSKNIEPLWTGNWEVIIKDANGKTLKEIPFEIKGTEVSGN